MKIFSNNNNEFIKRFIGQSRKKTSYAALIHILTEMTNVKLYNKELLEELSSYVHNPTTETLLAKHRQNDVAFALLYVIRTLITV